MRGGGLGSVYRSCCLEASRARMVKLRLPIDRVVNTNLSLVGAVT